MDQDWPRCELVFFIAGGIDEIRAEEHDAMAWFLARLSHEYSSTIEPPKLVDEIEDVQLAPSDKPIRTLGGVLQLNEASFDGRNLALDVARNARAERVKLESRTPSVGGWVRPSPSQNSCVRGRKNTRRASRSRCFAATR
jgi:hypothetical protein